MKFVRTGVILSTENYQECVAFYRDLFGLKILFQDEHAAFRLTCFEWGGSYLMVETDGWATPGGATAKKNSAKLRFNVSDINAALEAVQSYGIDTEIVEHDWGRTIEIHDPDGTLIGIRDEATFGTGNAVEDGA